MKRIMMIGGAVGVVLIMVLLFVLLTSINRIVKVAIETYGSEAAGTEVSVESVEIELTKGKGTITGLEVANPDGFEADYIFRMGRAELDLDLTTLNDDLIVIEKILLASTEVNYEIGKNGTNLAALQKGMSGSAASEPSAHAEEGEETKFLIRHLWTQGAKVTATSHFAKGQKVQATLPQLHLQNLGGEKGVTGAELASQLMNRAVREVSAGVRRIDIGKLKGGLEKGLQDAGDAVGKGLKKLFD